MPWRESSVMEERLRFVARLLEGESMSAVCRSFGIPRKTGYKIFSRYREQTGRSSGRAIPALLANCSLSEKPDEAPAFKLKSPQ